MEAKHVVQTMSIEEKDESKFLLQHRRTKLRLMWSFGRKIVIQGRRQHYIRGNTWLVAVDHDCSSNVVSTFSTASPFMIKCHLLGESLKYLSSIARDEAHTNVLKERGAQHKSRVNTSHLFVLPM